MLGGGDTRGRIAALQRGRLAVTIFPDAAVQGRRAGDDALALLWHAPIRQNDRAPSELVTDRRPTTRFSR
ncbi:hypothetical protein [Methylobacterium sp. J-070]|uniref:hypothetical protein n=1 Tax=Methylobacterium sp. J-070 TaxID=2836650 RepID=UPI001FBAED18|nr:hypothetical protein [Methylobacterium sp. J-070]MCJ2051571.1 hypothetical protein [Methylobacterium sp. J-070]